MKITGEWWMNGIRMAAVYFTLRPGAREKIL